MEEAKTITICSLRWAAVQEKGNFSDVQLTFSLGIAKHLRKCPDPVLQIRPARAAHDELPQLSESGKDGASTRTCRDCSARSMYSMVSRRAQKAGTAPWRTMEEQEDGSTSARNVSARAASSMISGLCSEFSRCTCAAAVPQTQAFHIRCICGIGMS